MNTDGGEWGYWDDKMDLKEEFCNLVGFFGDCFDRGCYYSTAIVRNFVLLYGMFVLVM